MQACRLSLAEVSHPAKVVKVWLDPSSQSLALMLSDSSCLLYSLKFTSIAVQVAGPVTDGCFLRLLQKKKLKQLPQKQKSRRAGGAPYDRGVSKEEQGTEGAVVFLATMPARGGCRTVLRAWSRERDSSFSRSLVEMKDSSKGLKFSEGLGKRAAAVLDLPHGFAVKIAASVNVFVVHSASTGKIWVMAAKVKQLGDDSSKLSENSTETKRFSAKLEGLSGKLAGAFLKLEDGNGIRGNLEELRSSGECRVCISLIKCSVVDCNGPVYSIRVSLQHMIIGEENGVRVWALRPLVRGKSKKRVVVGEKGKEGLIVNKFGDLDKGNRQLSCVESVPKAGGLDQGSSLESDMELSSAANDQKLGAVSELNLQTTTVEGYLQPNPLANGKLEALDQLNLQASFVEGNAQLNSMDRGRPLDHLNLQANSAEGNLQLNSVENGKKIRALDGANSVENGKEEQCLVKEGKAAIVGEELMLDNFVEECNDEVYGK